MQEFSWHAERYKVDLVGGDTTSSQTGLVINVTAVGLESSEKIISRNGAKPNDLLVVTGDLGGAYMGLQILEREHSVYLKNPNMQPEMEGYDYILERQLKPEARADIKEILEELGVKPTSMIDISDGLASEVLHLSDRSKVGFRIYEEKIPMDELTISAADEFNLNPVMTALNGGETMNCCLLYLKVILIKLKTIQILPSSGMLWRKSRGIIWFSEGLMNLLNLQRRAGMLIEK